MQNAIADHAFERTAVLADALRDTVAELRLIEVEDMVAYMRTGRWANIADLVRSSAELYFEDGALSFACSGDFEADRSAPASLSLDMEFQRDSITAFFTLTLQPADSLVEIKKLWFGASPRDEATATRRFAQALAAARLPAMRREPRGAA